jgi:hypothetical protein
MRHIVTVVFDTRQSLDIPVDANELPPADEARRWLDGEFTRLDCSPLRASGKVLTADKLLAVADAAGPLAFDDVHWQQTFGRATCAALGRPVVRVDLSQMTVRS